MNCKNCGEPIEEMPVDMGAPKDYTHKGRGALCFNPMRSLEEIIQGLEAKPYLWATPQDEEKPCT